MAPEREKYWGLIITTSPSNTGTPSLLIAHHFWCENSIKAVTVHFLRGGRKVRVAERLHLTAQSIFLLLALSQFFDTDCAFMDSLSCGPNCFEVQILSMLSSPILHPGTWQSWAYSLLVSIRHWFIVLCTENCTEIENRPVIVYDLRWELLELSVWSPSKFCLNVVIKSSCFRRNNNRVEMCAIYLLSWWISVYRKPGGVWGLHTACLSPELWAVTAGKTVMGKLQLKVCKLKSRKRAETVKAIIQKRIIVKGNLFDNLPKKHAGQSLSNHGGHQRPIVHGPVDQIEAPLWSHRKLQHVMVGSSVLRPGTVGSFSLNWGHAGGEPGSHPAPCH